MRAGEVNCWSVRADERDKTIRYLKNSFLVGKYLSLGARRLSTPRSPRLIQIIPRTRVRVRVTPSNNRSWVVRESTRLCKSAKNGSKSASFAATRLSVSLSLSLSPSLPRCSTRDYTLLIIIRIRYQASRGSGMLNER